MTTPSVNRLQTLLHLNGYVMAPRSKFISEAPTQSVKEAEEMAIGAGGFSWVIYDPENDCRPCAVSDSPHFALVLWYQERRGFLAGEN